MKCKAVFFALYLLSTLPCSASLFAQPYSVQLAPSVVKNGGLAFGTITANGTNGSEILSDKDGPKVKFYGKEISVFPFQGQAKVSQKIDSKKVIQEKPNVSDSENQKNTLTHKVSYRFFLGIPYEALPGKSEIQIEWLGHTSKVAFEITTGKYAEEKLKVDPSKVSPPQKYIKRILAEKQEVGEIYRTIATTLHLTGPLQLPIESPVTSQYGNKRTFNGKLSNYHSGLDLKAKVGTPVKAAAPGMVVLAKDLYFTGGTIIIDHGFGFYSLYAHLSKIKVKRGDNVDYSTLIALSGDTGRVSGPHLHWGTIFNGTKVDPAQALRIVGTQDL